MGNRPRIGISMRLELETRRFYLGRDYSEAIWECGGLPVHIALIPDPEYIKEVLANLDGILLPGSNTDVDPYYYGEEPHQQLGTVIPEKDETDQLLIGEAERLGLPIFGICYGMQAINVARGGSLVQDIQSQLSKCLKHEQGTPADRGSHSIRIGSNSILARLAGDEAVRVNSSHHQAIGKLGRNLNAAAWADDSVIECIEEADDDKFVFGVQWHPELSVGNNRLSRELFILFVDRCRRGGRERRISREKRRNVNG